tara:strand:+ start:3617 stop:5473 length:1857 start_codon:yes stop_codon:yes gene_type:complete
MATELDKLVVKIEADLSDLKKKMNQANKVVGNSSKKMSAGLNNLSKSLAKVTATATKVGAVLGVAFGAVFVKGVIDTGIQIENLQIRLKALFGTAEEGERAFEAMLSFAGKVPFTLGEIQQASGNLAVVANDADELAKVLEITGNVASVTGLDFQQTAEQIQRSFSGGIASADVFRERGVRDLLGFSAGATVSAEETREAFERVFGRGGTFGNVTDELANTLTGTISMIKDKFMQFQIAVSESFFEELKMQFGDLNAFLDDNQERIKEIGRTLGETLAKFTRFLVDNIQGIKDFFTALAGIAVINAIARLGASITTLTTIMLANPLFMIMTGIALGGIAIHQLTKEVLEFVGANDKLKESLEAQNKEFNRVKEARKKFNDDAKLAIENIKKQNQARAEELEKLKEKFKLQAQIKKIQMDRDAQERGEAFDLEMEQLEKVNQVFEDIGKNISTAFGEAVVSGKDFKDSMVDIFQSVLQQVVALIFQLAVIEPILKRIKETMTASSLGGGSMFQNILAGVGSIFSFGGRAMGGNVNPNMPYMVGERGAEMFVPKSAGTIVPNNQLGGGITIEQNLNFATGVSQTVRAEVLNLLPAIKENTLSAVREARLRGGTFAKDFGA